MTNEVNGTDVLLNVNTGTPGVPVWTAVGSQRGVDIERSANVIETSNKQSGGHFTGKAGRKSSTVSLDSLYLSTGNAGYDALKTAYDAGDTILVQTYESGSAKEEAEAIITNMSESFPDDAEATISVDFTITGGWSAAA